MMSILMDGFLGRRLYAMSPATRFEAKLSMHLCLVCSIWQTFLSSSLTVSTSALFLSRILSCRFMREFFMFFLSLVTRCMSSTKRVSNSSRLMYPLSAKSFPKSLCVKSLSFKGSRSSTFPGVSVHCMISPRSLMTMCSFAYSGGYPFSISGDIRSLPS